MATVAQERSSASPKLIVFAEALRAFREWRSASIPLLVSYLGKAGFSETVRVSINGVVTGMSSDGVVTITGEGREMRLDLRVCEVSRARETDGEDGVFDPLDPDVALQLTFPSGGMCLVLPRRSLTRTRGRKRRRSGEWKWLRNRLTSPMAGDVTVSDAIAELGRQTRGRRMLFVDVGHGQANIVEVVDGPNGDSRVRRLKEQFLPQDDRMHADRLKRKIIHGENGGAYSLDGFYRPRTEPSARELARLVEELERRDGAQAWDRRRYPR